MNERFNKMTEIVYVISGIVVGGTLLVMLLVRAMGGG